MAISKVRIARIYEHCICANYYKYPIAGYFHMVEIFVYFLLESIIIIRKLKLRNYPTAIDSTSHPELYK